MRMKVESLRLLRLRGNIVAENASEGYVVVGARDGVAGRRAVAELQSYLSLSLIACDWLARTAASSAPQHRPAPILFYSHCKCPA